MTKSVTRFILDQVPPLGNDSQGHLVPCLKCCLDCYPQQRLEDSTRWWRCQDCLLEYRRCSPVLPLTAMRGAAVSTFGRRAQEMSHSTRRPWSTKVHYLAIETTGLWQQLVKGYKPSPRKTRKMLTPPSNHGHELHRLPWLLIHLENEGRIDAPEKVLGRREACNNTDKLFERTMVFWGGGNVA